MRCLVSILLRPKESFWGFVEARFISGRFRIAFGSTYVHDVKMSVPMKGATSKCNGQRVESTFYTQTGFSSRSLQKTRVRLLRARIKNSTTTSFDYKVFRLLSLSTTDLGCKSFHVQICIQSLSLGILGYSRSYLQVSRALNYRYAIVIMNIAILSTTLQ